MSTLFNVNSGLYKNLPGFTPSFTLFLGSIKALGNGEIVEYNLFSNYIIFLYNIIIPKNKSECAEQGFLIR